MESQGRKLKRIEVLLSRPNWTCLITKFLFVSLFTFEISVYVIQIELIYQENLRNVQGNNRNGIGKRQRGRAVHLTDRTRETDRSCQ